VACGGLKPFHVEKRYLHSEYILAGYASLVAKFSGIKPNPVVRLASSALDDVCSVTQARKYD